MAKTPKHKIPRRSGEAQAALGRRAPVMAHRNTPRGGQRNIQAELMSDNDDLTGSYEMDRVWGDYDAMDEE